MIMIDKLIEDGWIGDVNTTPYNFTLGDPEGRSMPWAKLIAYGADYGSNVDIYYCENDASGNTEIVQSVFKGLVIDDVFLDDLYEALMLFEPDPEQEEEIRKPFDPRLN